MLLKFLRKKTRQTTTGIHSSRSSISGTSSKASNSTASTLSHLTGDIKNIPLTKKGIVGTRIRNKTVFAMYTLVGAENVKLSSREIRREKFKININIKKRIFSVKLGVVSPHFDDLTTNPMMVGTHHLFIKSDIEKIQQAFISKATVNPHQMILALGSNPAAARQIIKDNPEFINQLMALNNQWVASQHTAMQSTFDYLMSKTSKQTDDLQFVNGNNSFLRKYKLKELAKLSYHKEPKLLFSKLHNAFDDLEASKETTIAPNTLKYTDLQDGEYNIAEHANNNEATIAYSALPDLQKTNEPAKELKNKLAKELKELQTVNPSLYQELKELVATFQEQRNTAIRNSGDLDKLSYGGSLLSSEPTSQHDLLNEDIQTVKNEVTTNSESLFSEEAIQTIQEKILNARDTKFKRKLTSAHIQQTGKNAKHLAIKAPAVAFGGFVGSWGGVIGLGEGVKSTFASDKALNGLKSTKEKIINLASSRKTSSSEMSDVTIENMDDIKYETAYGKDLAKKAPKISRDDIQKSINYNQQADKFEAQDTSSYIERDQTRAIYSEKDMDMYSEVSMSDVSEDDIPKYETTTAIHAGISTIQARIQQLQQAAREVDDTISFAATETYESRRQTLNNNFLKGFIQAIDE